MLHTVYLATPNCLTFYSWLWKHWRGCYRTCTNDYCVGLCQRRQWPDPYYQVSVTRAGYRCVVRVNNREYQTSNSYMSESLAKEGAALTAYSICRNFSANDGMYPAGFAHGGVIQGNPVPVGSGRHSHRNDGSNPTTQYRYAGDSDSSGSRSGGSSPDFRGEPRLAHDRIPNRHQLSYVAAPRHEPHRNRHSGSRY